MAPEFLYSNGNHVRFTKLLFQECLFTAPWWFLLSFIVSFCLQIRKIRNLQIGIDKHVGKVSINLLYHSKYISHCVISIIINAPAVVYAHS